MKIFTTIALALALVAIPAMAQPPDDDIEVVVTVTVQEFVQIEVIDPAINFVSSGTGPWHNDLSGMGNTPGVHRARFKVSANGDYSLTVTSATGTWQATNLIAPPWGSFEQVRFEGISGDADPYDIGGVFYLDRTPDIGTITHYWDGNTASIVTEAFAPEVHTWGLSAAFAPELVVAAGGTGGIVNMVAPPGPYRSTAVITAALVP